MRTKFTLPVVLLGILFVMQSCSKGSQQEMVLNRSVAEVINATVAANSMYELNLDKYGIVKISKQAAHFQESSTGIDSKTGLLVYKYMPAADFKGNDEVVLSSTKEVMGGYSGGDNCNPGSNHNSSASQSNTTTITSYITVKLKVID